jgi:chromosome segregation ATPase
VYDPATARVLLERLLSAHPTSGHSIDPATLALHSLLVDMEHSRAAVAAREAALRDTLTWATAEAERLRDEIDLLEAQLGEKRQENSDMRLLIDRLAADLRGREAQLTEIRDELARLKAIDLQRPPVRSH